MLKGHSLFTRFLAHPIVTVLRYHRRSFASIPVHDSHDVVTLNVGDQCEYTRTFTLDDGHKFIALSGDDNPIHSRVTANAVFGAPIVHGMFVASMISRLFAHHIPGAIYLSQTLSFMKPVYYQTPMTAIITVTALQPRTQSAVDFVPARVTCTTNVVNADGDTCITGNAVVRIPKLKITTTAMPT